jgi:CRISPR/Cas system-associated endonuclease Cas1
MDDLQMAKKQTKPAQSIEELKAEYARLHERKIQAETQLQSATDDLEALKREAEEQFQTSDIAELQRMLEKMELENEERRQKYQELLEGISTELTRVESNAEEGAPTESTDVE